MQDQIATKEPFYSTKNKCPHGAPHERKKALQMAWLSIVQKYNAILTGSNPVRAMRFGFFPERFFVSNYQLVFYSVPLYNR